MKLNLENFVDKIAFMNILRTNIVKFRYTKINGSKKIGNGSLAREFTGEYFSEKSKYKGKDKKGNNAKPEQITYWDIDANGWRSPRLVGQTINIIEVKPVKSYVSKEKEIDIKIMATNTQLINIYDAREELKLEKKKLTKEYSNIDMKIEKHEENAEKIIRISKRLNDIKEERIYLNSKVKKLKKYKENLEKSKKLY